MEYILMEYVKIFYYSKKKCSYKNRRMSQPKLPLVTAVTNGSYANN